MIQLIVLTLRGTPLTQTLAGVFGPAGGTLGRAPSNTLVLDDPDRTVSRVHAQLLCRDGAFFAVDRGSNPMQHNGRVVGSGNEVPLADGDRLLVGGFELEVKAYNTAATAHVGSAPAAASAAEADDPFADLLAGIAPAARTPAAAPPSSPDSPLLPDPLAAAPSQGRANDPFGDLLGPAPGSASSAPSAPSASRGGGLLDDFSDIGQPAARGGGIDALFGGMGPGSAGSDPLALSPLADPLDLPRTADAADPFAALQGGARPGAPATQSDHLPMGRFAYRPPAVAKPAAAAPAPAFDDLTGLPHDAAEPPPVAGPAESASAAHTPRATDDELLAALLRGLASTHQPPQMLTPGLMERIGVALRAATEGTLHLLLARQEFKREVRAEVTLIASKANNPLKFSPTPEIALAHLLGPGMRGFMAPEAAMRDAYDDLRAHQFGVMVGMRAALAHVIARFEPAELENKIASKSALENLFTANRKARLWDQFVSLYGSIAADAEDDFHSLFGKAFVEAYEAQMKKLKAEAPRRAERE